MKKILPIILSAVSLLAVLSFTACNDHTHTVDHYDHDENSHWGVCSCGEEFEKEAHHSEGAYEVDENYHWKVCDVCGEEFDKAEHVIGGNGECVCGYSLNYTRGLSFGEIKKDGVVVAYQVNGIGTATGSTITIQSYYNGKAVTSIASDAFRVCTNLTRVVIPDTVTEINNFAFYGCSSLESVTIPEGVFNISASTFYGCSSLTSVTLPANLATIGDNAFYNCNRLTEITIPASVTLIGNEAFLLCSSLTTITFEGTVEQWQEVVRKGSDWNKGTANVTVRCSDGTV